MFFILRVFFHTLILILFMEAVALRQNMALYLVFFLALFSVISAKNLGKKWIYSIIPPVLSFSSIIILYLIDNEIQKQVFIILASAVYYLLLLGIFRLGNYSRDNTARGMIVAGVTTALFFLYASVYGIYLNFFIPLWVLMLVFLVFTILICYGYFGILEVKRKNMPWTYSLLIGMVMSEISWVMNFWPFGYLTAGVIALIFYYVLWDLAQSHFLNLLSKKRVVANMVVLAVLVGIALISSKWLPMV